MTGSLLKDILRNVLLGALLVSCLLLSACRDDGPSVLLVGEDAPKYVIIRGDNAKQDEIEAAVFLRKYLEKCGVETEIITDWEKNPVSDYEFVVGDTLRAENEAGMDILLRDVGKEGYFVKVSGSRVYMAGGSAATTRLAVEHFLTEFFGYAGDPETAAPASEVSIGGDYEFIKRKEYPLSAITVDGRDLREFRITWDADMNSALAEAAAEDIQTKMYRTTGIWLEIAQADAWEGPAVHLSREGAEDGCFRVDVQNGNLVLAANVSGASHEHGFSRFFNEYIRDAEGELIMDKNFKYEENIGSFVTYSEFGAKGDGKTNDIAALIAAHEYANANGLEVRADAGAVYYIGAADKGAVIRTNTDWSGATFIIDDSEVGTDMRGVCIFTVSSAKEAYSVTDQISSVKKGQENLGITLPEDSIVVLVDSGTKRYIREGKNANSGSDQTDIIVVDKDGNVDAGAPVIWDYENVTSARVIPMDKEVLTIRGGTFTTVANNQPSTPSYYNRGIKVNRSNVVVEDITHYVEGEGTQGAPYSGILVINDCANITVRDCIFTAHKTYENNYKGLGTVSQGTYDISPSRVVNLTFENCTQTNDILDTEYWGIMGSNFCKNIVLKDCSFSRFDAHQGVANVTIIGSTLGHQCLNAIGCGTLRVEDSTLYGSSFINLRGDYGSTWEGEVIIRDCTWIPNKGNSLTGAYSVLDGSYSGFHNFGYECYMPTNITIENLYVDDSNADANYKGIYLLGNITHSHTDEEYEKKVAAQGFPYHVPETITISGFTSESGKKWNLSPNTFMFRSVTVNDLDIKE